MMVKDIMTPVTEVLRGYEFLDQAAMTMKRLGSKRLPVIDHSQVVGILNEQMCEAHREKRGVDLTKVQVRNVMLGGDMTCSEHLPIQDMVPLLEKMHKTVLVVLDHDGRAVGIVSEENLSERVEVLHGQV